MSLADRMKRYEAVYQYRLTPRSPVIVRVDGRAFHTYTRNCQRPYDPDLRNAMVFATQALVREMQGCKLAYQQSDEASFVLTDYDRLESQGWFNYELSKIVSLSASIFTATFARFHRAPQLPAFDARAFVVPVHDVPNYFVWRAKDWARNSLTMLAQTHFSPQQLHGKNQAAMHEMLHQIGVNWADRAAWEKCGTFVFPDGSLVDDVLPKYEGIRDLFRYASRALDCDCIDCTINGEPAH